ncbi:protein of unknown function [Jatrophihabitans endophyticus]|uniref:DUF1540 domain-containing protein n=1 Tax=Jatrophihabitans endophyticus TaxID=1206085 RepID=A0A1M5EM58_9ACTN|nr:DUF1540 domain-containing protein [Jatrophihabitans endophyticus]SHF80200.1 protein of unknown function [Jatrophihabitans endophyticus]
MTAVHDLPQVHDCAADDCAYNADAACHAGAITIGGDHAHCGTFINIEVRAASDRQGLVGACHRTDCTHNAQLECTAPTVSVGAGTDAADCLTFEAR